MVVSEKALVSRMKEAYKTGGYTVATNGDRHMVSGGTWAVEIDSDNLPREAIALLAGHMGFLPKPGGAYKIMKTKEGPQVQHMIYEEAEREFENLEGGSTQMGVVKTLLTLDGCNIWQQTFGTAVHLIRPDLEELFRKKEDVRFSGGVFKCNGEISRARVLEIIVDPEHEKIRCLSSIRWTI